MSTPWGSKGSLPILTMNNRAADTEQLELTLYATLDIISDGVWDWNANTGYVYRSPGWYRMLGYDVDSLENTVFTWESVIHSDDYTRVMEHFNAYISGTSDHYNVEYRCRTLEGGYRWVEDRGRVVEWNEDGSVARMIGAHRDIHERELARMELEQRNRELNRLVEERSRDLKEANQALKAKVREVEALAEQDALTGVFNRHRFDKILHQERERASRYGTALSLILLDIDHFKKINDRYGHTVGDRVLIATAHYIQQHIRENDLLARWGGEEFAIIAPDSAVDSAGKLAEKLRADREDLRTVDDIRVTCSFGVSQHKSNEDTDSLIRRADRALYRAKDAGRNRVVTA
jgi:diguanylate cyclase (GGDEF)-like protein/PAS domain S-box-containing protein